MCYCWDSHHRRLTKLEATRLNYGSDYLLFELPAFVCCCSRVSLLPGGMQLNIKPMKLIVDALRNVHIWEDTSVQTVYCAQRCADGVTLVFVTQSVRSKPDFSQVWIISVWSGGSYGWGSGDVLLFSLKGPIFCHIPFKFRLGYLLLE